MGNPIETNPPVGPQYTDPAKNTFSETSNNFQDQATSLESRSAAKAKIDLYAKPTGSEKLSHTPGNLRSTRILLAQGGDPRKASSRGNGEKIPPKKDKLSPITKKIAKNLLQEGQKLYLSGKFEEALVAFQKSYELTQNSAFLYNIAQCHRQLLKIPEALKFFRDYLKATPKAPNKVQVDEVIKALEKWEKFALEFPNETKKLFIEFQQLADQFPEENEDKYWPDFLSAPKKSEDLSCGALMDREKMVKGIIEQMTTTMNDEDPATAWAALLMMEKIALASGNCLQAGPEARAAYSAVEGLTSHLRPELRAQAAITLGGMTNWIRQKHPSLPVEELFAPPAKLLGLLNDPASQVRVAAVTALGHFRCGPQLLELYKKENSPEVRGALAESLGSMLAQEMADQPTPLDVKITEALAELFKDNEWVAEKAIFSLGRVLRRDPKRAWYLIKALDHPDALVRLRAADGLNNGYEHLTEAMRTEAIPKLKKLTGNEFEGPFAALVLATMGDGGYSLLTLNGIIMNSTSSDKRMEAVSYLEDVGWMHLDSGPRKGWAVAEASVMSVLNKLILDKDPKVQARAKRAIEKIKAERRRWGITRPQ